MAGTTVGSLVKSALVSNAKGGIGPSNLFTGKKLNGITIGGALAVGTLAAMGGPRSFGAQNITTENPRDIQNIVGPGFKNTMATRYSPAEEATAPSIMAGAREHHGGSQAPSLGASGDMVFGMHNSRKGMM